MNHINSKDHIDSGSVRISNKSDNEQQTKDGIFAGIFSTMDQPEENTHGDGKTLIKNVKNNPELTDTNVNHNTAEPQQNNHQIVESMKLLDGDKEGISLKEQDMPVLEKVFENERLQDIIEGYQEPQHSQSQNIESGNSSYIIDNKGNKDIHENSKSIPIQTVNPSSLKVNENSHKPNKSLSNKNDEAIGTNNERSNIKKINASKSQVISVNPNRTTNLKKGQKSATNSGSVIYQKNLTPNILSKVNSVYQEGDLGVQGKKEFVKDNYSTTSKLNHTNKSKKELKGTKALENVASKATTTKEYFFEPKHTKESPSWNENQANKQLNTVSNAASADQRSTINNEASHNSNSNNSQQNSNHHLSQSNSPAKLNDHLFQQLDMREKNIASGIMKRLGNALDKGLNDFEISLRPKNLGKLRIGISIDKNVTNVRIITETQSAALLLGESQSKLSQMMESAGLKLLDFSSKTTHDESNEKNDNGQNRDQKNAKRESIETKGGIDPNNHKVLNSSDKTLLNVVA